MAFKYGQEAAQVAAASLQANANKIAIQADNRAKNLVKQKINNGLAPILRQRINNANFNNRKPKHK